jgi:hypothetical protein
MVYFHHIYKLEQFWRKYSSQMCLLFLDICAPKNMVSENLQI